MRTQDKTMIVAGDDRKKLLAIVAGVALAAGVGGWALGRSGDDAAPVAAEVDVDGHGGVGEEGEEKHGPEGFVELAPAAAVASGIVTEAASAGTLASEIIAQASVTAPPDGRSSLTARADGAVMRIAKRLGDPVAAGETVALIESRDASAIVAERAGAAARATAANVALDRERRLFAERITARQDLEAAQSLAAQAGAELRRTDAAIAAVGVTGDGRSIAVRSLIGGRITKIDAELGAYVSAGTELFAVAIPRCRPSTAATSCSCARARVSRPLRSSWGARRRPRRDPGRVAARHDRGDRRRLRAQVGARRGRGGALMSSARASPASPPVADRAAESFR